MSVKWRGSVTVICWRIQTILWEALKERKGNWVNDVGKREPFWVFKQSGFPSYYLTLPLSTLPLWEISGPEFLLHTQESWTHHGRALVFLHRPACGRVLLFDNWLQIHTELYPGNYTMSASPSLQPVCNVVLASHYFHLQRIVYDIFYRNAMTHGIRFLGLLLWSTTNLVA